MSGAGLTLKRLSTGLTIKIISISRPAELIHHIYTEINILLGAVAQWLEHQSKESWFGS